LPPRQHHLMRAFLVELAQPSAFFVRVHGRFYPLAQTVECSLFVLKSQAGLYT
jgi:hypothetical protein